MDLLNSIGDEMKLIIINNLTKSLVSKKKSKLESLFGSWKGIRTTDVIIA